MKYLLIAIAALMIPNVGSAQTLQKISPERFPRLFDCPEPGGNLRGSICFSVKRNQECNSIRQGCFESAFPRKVEGISVPACVCPPVFNFNPPPIAPTSKKK